MPKLLDRLRKKDDVDLEDIQLKSSIAGYPHLMALKPKERYVFRSDYFTADGYYSCILAFFHSDDAIEVLDPFWGVMRVPRGLDRKDSNAKDITVVVLDQVTRMDDAWVESRQTRADKLDKMSEAEQREAGNKKGRKKASKIAMDNDETTTELMGGDAYLNVHMRLFVKAPSLEILDEAIEKISAQYIGPFPTLTIAPHHGEQRSELSHLFSKNEKKRGRGFHFTSSQYAGAYSLITNGLNDPEGEYVGQMTGDFNTSAILMDVDDYSSHVVLANSRVNRRLGNAVISDMWASKLSQAALLNNHKVVHFILNDSTDLDKLGPRFDTLTHRIDLTRGDINMFEVFGKREDTQRLFPAQVQKLILMAEQLYQAEGSTSAILRNELSDILTQFYIDNRMWRQNASDNFERLRLVGVPHEQVPLLHEFINYLDERYLESKNDTHTSMTDNYKVLASTFKSLLDTNGDLFDNYTSSVIDQVGTAQRMIYDFSSLMMRGPGVAMAQLVNVISVAVNSLGDGDVVIIHGAENIVNSHDFRKGGVGENSVKQYIDTQLAYLRRRGGRVVMTYRDIEKMLVDQEFNQFQTADYTILGTMSDKTVLEYESVLQRSIPNSLRSLVTNRNEDFSYLRRGVDNVVFRMDLALGINPNRNYKRRGLASTQAPQELMLGDMAGAQVVESTKIEKSSVARRRRSDSPKRTLRKSGNTSGATRLTRKEK